MLKITFYLSLFSFFAFFGQEVDNHKKTITLNQSEMKGKLYVYWGWNRGVFSNSDIHFSGEKYDFNLKDVVARDRQSKFSLDYFNPTKITIPQYNVRIGYFFHENWDVSIGTDHMKYVVVKGQSVKISGKINDNTTAYDGTYQNENIFLKEDFLTFEHTDGLNFVNAEIKRFDYIFKFNKVKIGLTEGIGIGILYPKTNTKLMNKMRYDEFHFSGYGISSILGLNFTFFDKFFIQSELKGGYINMPFIRTTISENDSASQDFFYGQANILFGGYININ